MTTLGPPQIEPGEAFSFVVTGDGRAPLPNMPFPRVQLDIMREIALLGPTFVLYTGDSVWGYGASRQELLNDYDRFRALANSTGVPLYNAPGNHEMQSDPAAVEILCVTGQDLYGSFDAGEYHFIALNTDGYPARKRSNATLAAIAATGFNAIRIYTVPPRWLWGRASARRSRSTAAAASSCASASGPAARREPWEPVGLPSALALGALVAGAGALAVVLTMLAAVLGLRALRDCGAATAAVQMAVAVHLQAESLMAAIAPRAPAALAASARSLNGASASRRHPPPVRLVRAEPVGSEEEAS